MRENCFWWALWTRMEKRVFIKLIAAYLVPGVLICSSNETISKIAVYDNALALYGVHLFCTSHVEESVGDVMGITTTALFQFLTVQQSPWTVELLLIYYCVSSNGSCLAFTTILSLTVQIREPL
jgi:hypothetical protein